MTRKSYNKMWFVKHIGYETRCNNKEEALSLYKSCAQWDTDLALEEYNCNTGESKFIRRKGNYFKEHCA